MRAAKQEWVVEYTSPYSPGVTQTTRVTAGSQQEAAAWFYRVLGQYTAKRVRLARHDMDGL